MKYALPNRQTIVSESSALYTASRNLLIAIHVDLIGA